MILYHGTSRKNLPSIEQHGIKMTEREVWPDRSVCAMDSLAKAKSVAKYFGQDGVVLKIDVPDKFVLFHPDYGGGPEFDTIYVLTDVPPDRIVGVVDAPSSLPDEYARPVGISLRAWKSSNDQDRDFQSRLDSALDDL